MDRDEIRKACEIGGFALESVAAQWVPALLAENDELREALHRFGCHEGACWANEDEDNDCTCGLRALLVGEV